MLTTLYSKLKSFPSAYHIFELWVERTFETRLALWNGTVRLEDVVTFLDAQGVYIAVLPLRGSELSDVDLYFESSVLCPFMYNAYRGVFFDRESATEEAILKSFELLEKKLKLN